MLNSSPHIVFAGGGTAGHLHPGLAVARQLSYCLPKARITFAGSSKPNEHHTVAAAGFEYAAIPSRPIPRSPWQAVRFATDNLAGYCAARWLLREQAVDLVVGLGGFASAATVRAAQSAETPVVLLEQNALPGRATRWLAPRASLVCAAFHEVRAHLPASIPLRFTGNPVRPDFQRLYWTPRGDDSGEPHCERRLLILGGSGGSSSINQNVPRAMHKLRGQMRGWRIVHQTGAGQLDTTQRLYHKFGLEALVVSFIDEMAEVMGRTDLVISRAGGTTLAELAMAGLPALLLPFPQATDNHQMENAQALANGEACRVLDERSSDGRLDDRLVQELTPLLSDGALCRRMGEQMRTFAHPNAASDVAESICQLLGVETDTPRRAAA